MQALTARASELEQAWSFGVVRQLLESRVVRAGELERAELLAGSARYTAQAVEVAERCAVDR